MAVGVRTDAEIKRDIADALYWDDRVNPSDVNGEVHDGCVVLSGTVRSHAARQAAEEDARAVVGEEMEIENRLTVKYAEGAEIPTDEKLESIAMNMLQWDAEIDASDVRAIADAGRITLKGSVPAYWQKLRAEDVMLSIRGVRGVTNELAVVPTKKYEDRKIAEQIIAALERNIYVNPDDIDIKINNGVVTLTGAVPDRRAYRAARDAARYTPGVVDVINELLVEEE
jgi:osmotically-inducible protein OsmY